MCGGYNSVKVAELVQRSCVVVTAASSGWRRRKGIVVPSTLSAHLEVSRMVGEAKEITNATVLLR